MLGQKEPSISRLIRISGRKERARGLAVCLVTSNSLGEFNEISFHYVFFRNNISNDALAF